MLYCNSTRKLFYLCSSHLYTHFRLKHFEPNFTFPSVSLMSYVYMSKVSTTKIILIRDSIFYCLHGSLADLDYELPICTMC